MAKVNAGDDNEDRKRLKEKLKVALRSRAMQSRGSPDATQHNPRLARLAVHTGPQAAQGKAQGGAAIACAER